MTKQAKTLGKTGVQVPAITLGGNVFGWTVKEQDSFRILDRAVDLGLNFIDTADVYSRWAPGNEGGESETILGKWFAQSGKRSQVLLATKVGMEMGEGKKGLSVRYIAQAVEASLRRLQTDHIDLYQSHRDDPEVPLEETLGAYQRLIEEGKVRWIGASNYSGARLKEAAQVSGKNGLPEYVSLQPLYSLVERSQYESDLAGVAAELKLAVIPYFSLASGFLTGKYRRAEDAEGRARKGMVSKYLTPSGFALVKTLDKLAKAAGTTSTAVALAWLNAKPTITAPIASATTEQQLEELAAAASFQLSPEAVAELDEVSSRFQSAVA